MADALQKYAWYNDGSGWTLAGYFDTDHQWHGQWGSGRVDQFNGQWVFSSSSGTFPVSFTPDEHLNPDQMKAYGLAGATQAPGGSRATRSVARATRSALSDTRSETRPETRPVTRPSAAVTQSTRRTSRTRDRQWFVQGRPPHAYSSRGVDLGLLVNDNQTVKPTNGGRLWALYNLAADGTLRFVGRYGTVPGAPPPPNAALNEVPAQLAPPPVFAAAPPPVPVSPYAAYVSPVYAAAPPVYVPQPIYSSLPAPVAAAPTYAPLAGTPGIPGYDPVTGMPLTPAQAAYQGAAYGAAQAAEELAASQPALDPLTASLLSGGGYYDLGGDFSGMNGGMDASTLSMLAGGNADLALDMALGNGGFDPSLGGFY